MFGLGQLKVRAALAAPLLVGWAALTWAATFGWLSITRHLAGGTHAEDLGFTDQVLANFLRGHWFRMSVYQGASWNSELDISRIARPDSLLAFHFEPMLLLLVPLYALGGMSLLLLLQAAAVAAGALPAFRVARLMTGSARAGCAVALAYLLSPLGQWAVLADFHTATLAGALLLLAVERLVVARSTRQALIAAGLAALAREDVGLVVATLGLGLWLVRRADRCAALAFVTLGLILSVTGLTVISAYSGGHSPFEVRYAPTLAGGPPAVLGAIAQPGVVRYSETIGLSGAWLGLATPLALGPMLPSVALNVLSTSPWMMSGKAHYSALVLPLVTVAAAAGLGRVPRGVFVGASGVALVLGSALAYARDGVGPLGGDFAPATVTTRARQAAAIADRLPPDAAVSATSALVPRVSRRPRVYVFPAIEDAEFIFLDLRASSAPTSAGDVFFRTRALLEGGGWQVEHASDGLLLLHRVAAAAPIDIAVVAADVSTTGADGLAQRSISAEADLPPATYFDGRIRLLGANLQPSPDGAFDVDGPRSILRTVWRVNAPLPATTRLVFAITLRDGRQLDIWDSAPLWWNPPATWPVGQAVVVDIPEIPAHQFVSWQAAYSTPTP